MEIWAIYPELELIGGAVAVLVAALFLPQDRQRWCAWLSLAVLAGAALLLIRMAGWEGRLVFDDSYAVDGAALWVKLTVVAGAALAVLASVEWFSGDAREGEYYAILLFAAIGMVGLASAADVMEVVLALLLTSVCSYALVGWARSSGRATEAALKYFLFGAITNVALLYGVVLLYGLSGETTFAAIERSLPQGSGPALAFAAALVVVGVGFKVGLVPVHFWVPDVYQGGPAPVIAYLAAVPKIAALLALARFTGVLPAERLDWPFALALVSAASIAYGTLAMIPQTSVARLLAYSSIAQVGYILMAVVALGRSELAVPGLLYYLVAYLAMNLGAFAVVTELRGLDDLAGWSGLARVRPLLAGAMVLFLLSLIGVPPLAGFVGKFAVFGAAIDAGYGWLAVLAAAATVVSIYPYIRLIAPIVLAPQPSGQIAVLGRWASVAVAVCAAATVALGPLAEPLLSAFERASFVR